MKKITQVLLGPKGTLFLMALMFLFTYNTTFGQEGKDGDLTVTTANTILNTYSPVTSDVSAGDTTVDVNDVTADLGGLVSGDLVLIYQAQGATINTTNTVNYGDITDYGSSGLYEFAYVSSVSINTITLTCAIANSYFVAGRTQVIKVPQYDTLTIDAGASVSALPWEDFAGSRRGGVVVIIANTIDINGDIDTSGLGFRGGVIDNNTSATGANLETDYVTSVSNDSAEKGESIVGFQTDYDALGGRYGRGAPANGGGGGNGHNAGGGGGSNGNNGNVWFNGAGVMCSGCTGAAAWTLDPDYIANGNALTNSSGGGRGGYSFGSSNQDALTLAPGSSAWGGDRRDPVGGLGGRPLIANEQNRIFLGGGGGAGDGNNNASQDAANGGGVILLGANAITGSGNIIANGANALPTVPGHNDAPGGGGGGGSIVLRAASIANTLILNANGGNGGDQLITGNESEGPGGGGGAGFVAISAGTPTININGGANGNSNSAAVTEFPTNGATQGANGESVTGIAGSAITCANPGTISGLVYNDADGDGFQDGGEAGIGSVTIIIRDVNGNTQTIQTNPDGTYTATLPPGNAVISILDFDPNLPTNAVQTQGDDPTTITVVAGMNTASTPDGFVVDTDGDGIGDPVDNCPTIANAGQADNDSDNVGNNCDSDDDNDGLLDTDEGLNCAATDIEVGTAPATNQNVAGFINDIYDFDGVDVDITTTINQVDGGTLNILQVEDVTTLRIQGEEIDDGLSEGLVYTFTFSVPVTGVKFRWSGIDSGDKVTVNASGPGSQTINIGSLMAPTSFPSGVYATTSGGSSHIITGNDSASPSITSYTAGSGDTTLNYSDIVIEGLVSSFQVTTGKERQDGNVANNGLITFLFSNFTYCTYEDTDADDIPNHLDLDSDADGCSDANEAYNDANADGGDGGQFGMTDPATVDGAGLVTETGVDYTLGTNTNVTAGGANICTAPAPVILHQNPACTSTVFNLVWDSFAPNGMDEFDWTPDGALTNTFNDVDGSGVNITHTFSGETGTLGTWPTTGSTQSPSVDSNGSGVISDEVLEYFTNGFGTTGITQTITFSTNIYSIGFDLYHINENGSGSGDLFTVTATDGLGNTIFPTFTDSATPSYTSNGTNGQIDATGSSVSNQDDQIGVNFEDLDGIASITIVWQNCSTCNTGVQHGSAIGGFDFCTTIPASSDLSISKNAVLTTDADTSGSITAGDTVTFTVTVNNAGPNDATGVGVGDTVPDGYTTIGSISNSGSESGGLISWSGLSITSGSSLGLTYTAVVTATGNYTNFAEITASDTLDPNSSPDPTPDTDTPAEDDETSFTPPVVLTSDLSLAKSVNNSTPNVGDTIIFTLEVSNDGPNDLPAGATVTDQLPTGYTYVSDNGSGAYVSGTGVWTLPAIANGASTSLEITVTVDASGDYENVAEVTSSVNNDPDSTPNNDDGDQSEDDEDSNTPTVTPTSDLSLTKGVVLTTDADTSGGATPGDTVTFTVTVSNGGPNDATGVEVTDQVPNGYTIVGTPTVSQGTYTVGTGVWDVGTITNSGTATLTVVATVNATGTYVNVAEVTASDNFDPDSTPNNDVLAEDDQDDADPGVDPVSDLSLTKGVVLTTDADTSGGATPGDTVTFTVTVSNGGPNDATGVEVTDQVPNGYTIVGTPTVSQGTYTVGTGVWDVGTITNSGTATLTVVATVNATGTYVNVAEVTASDNFDPDSTPNNDVLAEDDQDDADPSVDPVSDLSLTKGVVLTTDADTSGNISVGDTVTFSITVTNDGPNDATGVGVGDIVPDGYTTIGSISNGGSETGGLISWSGLSITTTTPLVLTYTAVVTATGNYTNFAEITASDNFDPDSSPDVTPDTDTPVEDDETSATPEVPSLSVIKTVRVAGSALNEVIEYDIVVTNTGNITLTDIEITDANADVGSIVGSPITSLAPGASVTVTANQTITQADIDAGFIENSATATGDSPLGGPDDVTDVSDAGDESVETPNGDGTTDGITDNDPTVTDLVADPSLSVIKTVRVPGSALNDVIEYDIVVTNTGNVTLTDIEITDANADAGSIVGSPIASLAPGASVTVTANQTITQADIDAGFIENSATATGDSPLGGPDDVTDVSDAGDETVETPNGDGTTDGVTDNDPTVTDLIADPSLSVIKTVRVPGSVLNDVIEYDIVVTNTGNVTLTDIEITDANADAGSIVGSPIASLDPGESVTVTANQTITQADIDAGFIENSATATGDSPLGGPDDVTDVSDAGDETVETPNGDGTTDGVTDNDPTVTDLIADPSLSVIKTVRVPGSVLNNVIEYDIVVTNTGNVTLTDIEITDANADAGSIVGSPIASLDPGESVTVTANQTITQADIDAGFIENSATATGDSPQGGPDDVTDVSDAGDESVETPNGDGTTDGVTDNDPTVTDLVADPELTLVKTGVVNGSNAGDTITYTFTVTNTGNVTVDNIFIDDILTGSTNLAVTPSTLAPGEQGTAQATYVLTQADINNGEVINSATVLGEDPNGDDVMDVSDNGDETVDDNGDNDPTNDETITPIDQFPNLALTKTGIYVDVNGDDLPNVGDEIQYTFTVENTGNVDITNIILSDPLTGIVLNGGPIDLAVGEIDTTTFTATYVLTAEDVLSGEVINQATVTGQDPNGDDVVDISDDPNNTTDIDTDSDGDPEDETVTIIEGVFNDPDNPVTIYTGISPNGDGINDEFRIVGLSSFPDNTLRIYNRWGVEVFGEDGYEQPGVELFRGISNGRATISQKNELPVGTYYYVLEYINSRGENIYKAGYLYINR
ncbi:DUF7507 domain-containing protein [Aquimarina litoralis]|uniref:DUF7507 domain-containing protein n=1 Tax=Aquimarina litoralis TaxID=584605 RepID=UPI001C594785|nr:gliding motility-associated C-terminal domain-containing protein [Aquimarina litoralis]MBW1298793.1 DUF11 domain-containing protein [Aquimarina litoralis]